MGALLDKRDEDDVWINDEVLERLERIDDLLKEIGEMDVIWESSMYQMIPSLRQTVLCIARVEDAFASPI